MEKTVILSELHGRQRPDMKLIRAMVVSSVRNGGLELSESERRLLWCKLLDVDTESIIPEHEGSVEELRVLEADVRRTRQEVAWFRTEEAQKELSSILSRYCIDRNTPYRQGLNEIAAPFVLGRKGFALFSEFCSRYVDTLYASPSTSTRSTLLAACRLFGRLLAYHDSPLVLQLADAGLSPALYGTPWLLTLCARSLESLDATCRLFDLIISINEPALVFGFGLALLRSRREPLLRSCVSRVPEVLAHTFSSSSPRISCQTPKLAQLAPAAIAALDNTPTSLRTALTKALAGGGPRQESMDYNTGTRRSAVPSFCCDTENKKNTDQLLGLSQIERDFWLPVTVLEAHELVDALLDIPNGPLRRDNIILLDASPPGEASRLAAGRLVHSIWPTMEFIAFGSTLDQERRDAFLCQWATQRIQNDNTLYDKHIIVLGADDNAPRTRRRDALAEALLPRDLLRRGVSLVTAIKRYDWQNKQDAPRFDNKDYQQEDRFSDPGDDNQIDELITDAVASLVATALRDAGISRVSALERGGFEKVVSLAQARGKLESILPHFDTEHWLSYEQDLRKSSSQEILPCVEKPIIPADQQKRQVPIYFRRFGSGGKPIWAAWSPRGVLGSTPSSLESEEEDNIKKPPQQRRPNYHTRPALVVDRLAQSDDTDLRHSNSSSAIKFTSADFLDDTCFDEAYF